MTITDRDMAEQLDQTLDAGYGGEDFDRPAIIRELMETYGRVDLDSIPHDDFWTVVQKHDIGPEA